LRFNASAISYRSVRHAVVVTTAGLYGDKASVLTAGTTLYKFVFPAAVER